MFAKLQKVNVSFIMSVCQSIHLHAWNNLDPTGWIFMKFIISVFLKNLSRKFKFHDNWTRITNTLHKDQCTVWSYFAQFAIEWELFQAKVVEKIKTRILCSFTFFQKYYHLWANVEKSCRAGYATDDNMAHAHCMLDT